MALYNQLIIKIITLVMMLVGIIAIYVIVRMLVNRCNGRDDLDGLL
ncbi:hypothetical protein [Mucilaginibacter jinjuensis]|uniref:Uncharacterized protein n=1 Tax=Mucilaginibacter jinjuensis TaxID=1176721 RepID=A0ABY7TCN8_9SPHI|nr:hypothetical protein [Mucilaginibacter jinjuensis]WCT14103.1 hypothetical protein PQO05_09170 [Mucilaginibacter jinjuensis]